MDLASQLAGAVAKGLGGVSFGSDDYRNSLKAYLDQNIYAFSGAKSFAMLKEYNRLLLDEKGEILPFNQFRERALKVDALYNKTYLEAEYENCIASAQMAESWPGLAKFTLLQFSTSGGESVCPICGGFDRLIIASKDQILNRVCPPLHFKCKCKLIPAAGNATPTDRDKVKAIDKAAKIQPYFKNNPGKTKVIYNDNHPFIKNLKNGKLSELDAEKNYGMPSVEKYYISAKGLPDSDYTQDKATALRWWNDNAGDKKGNFDFKGADGLTVNFDRAFKNHVLEQNNDDRWKIISKAPDVLKNPNEIWTRRIGDKLSVTYIKYYDNGPVVLQVTAGEKVRADTIFEATHNGRFNTQELIKLRKGQLKYKK